MDFLVERMSNRPF